MVSKKLYPWLPIIGLFLTYKYPESLPCKYTEVISYELSGALQTISVLGLLSLSIYYIFPIGG